MKIIILRLVAAALIIAGAVFSFKGCQTTGTEVRTYHKVYKDKRTGYWEGQDVSYETGAMNNIGYLGLGIPLIIGGVLLAFSTTSGTKSSSNSKKEQSAYISDNSREAYVSDDSRKEAYVKEVHDKRGKNLPTSTGLDKDFEEFVSLYIQRYSLYDLLLVFEGLHSNFGASAFKKALDCSGQKATAIFNWSDLMPLKEMRGFYDNLKDTVEENSKEVYYRGDWKVVCTYEAPKEELAPTKTSKLYIYYKDYLVDSYKANMESIKRSYVDVVNENGIWFVAQYGSLCILKEKAE